MKPLSKTAAKRWIQNEIYRNLEFHEQLWIEYEKKEYPEIILWLLGREIKNVSASIDRLKKLSKNPWEIQRMLNDKMFGPLLLVSLSYVARLEVELKRNKRWAEKETEAAA